MRKKEADMDLNQRWSLRSKSIEDVRTPTPQVEVQNPDADHAMSTPQGHHERWGAGQGADDLPHSRVQASAISSPPNDITDVQIPGLSSDLDFVNQEHAKGTTGEPPYLSKANSQAADRYGRALLDGTNVSMSDFDWQNPPSLNFDSGMYGLYAKVPSRILVAYKTFHSHS